MTLPGASVRLRELRLAPRRPRRADLRVMHDDGALRRRWGAWFVVVPLMVAGTECAHALAYRLVYPQASVRWHVLASTGHGYTAWFPLLGGLAGAVVAIGLASEVVDVARGRRARRLPAWSFGLLPLAGFTLQEFLERLVAFGGFPWWMVEQPTFRIGLLLQVPFALAAFVVARLFLRAAQRIGLVLGARQSVPTARGDLSRLPSAALETLRSSVLASGHAGRAPPAGRVPLLRL